MQNKQKKLLSGLFFMLAVTLCFTVFIFINNEKPRTARADTAIEKPYFSGGTTSIEKEWSGNGNITASVTFPSIRNISYTFEGNGTFNYFTETTGIITANSVGVCTLTFTPKEGYVWADDGTATPVTLTFTVKGTDIADAFEFREIEKCVYDGTEKKPTPTIWNKQINGRMTEGQDFIYSGYSDNINAGEATITISGIGNYSGTLSTTFRIEKADFTPTITSPSEISKAVGLTFSGNTSGGEAFWSVEDGTGKATVDGYTLIPTQPGTVTVTLTIAETKNYNAATATQTVTISKADIIPDFTYPAVIIGNDPATPSVTGVSGDGAMTWSVSNGTGSATINRTTGVLSPTLAGTVEVTLTVAASTYYNESSATRTIIIEKGNITPVITSPTTVTFGEPLTLTFSGNPGGGEVTWKVTAGTGTATVSGSVLTPTLVGTIVITLTIAETANYNGGTATQTVTIKELPVPDTPADPVTPNSPQSGLSTAALVAVILVSVLAVGFATAAVIIAVRKKAGVSDADGFYDDIDGGLK